ncbi:MAG: formylglycine-generating enzyme family protein, partial [Verrucomicrobia bacterium]|nr:formylglycine-generating enzyme family protein [Verrucomicrobiota bacterium]
GWYWCNSDEATHPLGQKQPNAWGLYDMHGNVYEWCLDWFGDYPTEAVTDPEGSDTGSNRVVRGGAWNAFASGCRSAYRHHNGPGYNFSNYGFRVVLAPESKDMTIPLSDTVSLDMIWIEPGTFMMGSPTDELGRYDDETQHQVILTQGYWLGKYEVTQAQYEAVMGTNPSDFKGADLPVEQVSWNDAVKFCEWLTAQERAAGRLPEGYEYTLPTEAQWEYACRAGTTTAFNIGTNIPTMLQREDRPCPNLDPLAWYYYNSGEYDGEPFPVGQKQPNAWGLYDMHGNVFEWCLDRSGAYPASSVTDPKGSATGSGRVMRGGSWYDSASYCRSALRYYFNPDGSGSVIGFRVALAPVK